MMSVSARNAGTAKSYYTHLQTDAHRSGGEPEREDYYSQDAAGEWFGSGAEAMGLTGAVDVKDFHALADGYHPSTNEALVQNAGDTARVALYDATFSAPKSVSNVWAIGDEETRSVVERAHDEAVKATLAEMEDRLITTRRGRGGSESEKVGMTAALWRHGTSREMDEDLHTHATVMNISPRADGTWGTVDGRAIYEHQKILGAAYRTHLDERLREAGFQTQRDGESFRVSSVPQSLERASSTRRQQIEAAMAERGVSGAKAAQAAALDTRKTKDHNQDIEALRERWKERAAAHGFDAEKARGVGEPIPPAERRASIEFVQEIVTQTRAVFTEKDLEYSALVAAQGMGRGRQDAAELYNDALAECVILHAPDGTVRYSTPELVQKERETMEIAQAGQFKTDWTLTPEQVAQARAKVEEAAGHKLSDEQAKALEDLTTGRGQIQILVGDAGTGKSTTMNAVREAYEAAGYQVIGVAPQGKQAADLGTSAGIENSKTVHRLLSEIESGKTKLDAQTVIIADEMGKTDSRLMYDLTQAADAGGAKIIMLGDPKQMQPVGPGAMFRHLADQERGVGHARLEEIHRQRDAGDREAVRAMSKGESAEAMLRYLDKGQVAVEKTHRAAVKEIARKWTQAAQEVGAEKTLALASTNARVNDINAAVRSELKKASELQGGQTFEAVRELGTDPETGKMRTTTERMEFAPGDRVLFAGTNDYENDLRRGDLGTVISVDERGVAAKLDRDESVKLIDPERQDLRHGYAITADRSQGATVERVVAYATSDSIHREMSYVMASRAKDSTEWVTTEAQTKKIEDRTAPTKGMLAFADDLAARGEAPALTDEQRGSFAAVRDHLDQYSPREIGREGGPQKDAADERLDEFRDVVEAMSVSRQKESTLDYEARGVDDRERANDQLPEREARNDRERDTERDRDEGRERQPTGWDERAVNTRAEFEARRDDKAAERAAVECLKDYQAAADLHRQGRYLERQADREPDKDRGNDLRDAARAAHGQAEGIRAHADYKRDNLPDEYKQAVKDAEKEARRDEKAAARAEDRASTHYQRAAEHNAKANDWTNPIQSQALNAAEARLEKWMAERAATAAKEGMSDGRAARREGIEDVRQMTRDRAQERQAERQANRENDREHSNDRNREQRLER